jgi:hypothetical protein
VIGRGVPANVSRFFGESHAANSGAPGGPGLNLDHDFGGLLVPGQFFGNGNRFIRSRSRPATRNLESVGGQNGLTLIFVKSCHACVPFP